MNTAMKFSMIGDFLFSTMMTTVDGAVVHVAGG